jgi:membrane protein DedA with SNARE-associated domain
MLIPLTAAFLSSTIAREMLRWLRHLGGPGLIILGLLDSSIIPIPGSLDALTIVLAAAKLEVWPYYAFMATTGSVLGAYLTYRLARNQGEAALTNRLSRRNVERVNKFFAKWGLGAIVIPAILPPPAPMVPFVLAAGATKYPVRKFLIAFTVGRGIRFTLFAYLGATYGRHILRWISKYGDWILAVVLAMTIVAIAIGVLRWRNSQKKRSRN